MRGKTFGVILEYCGGARTDTLYECVKDWNPKYEIAVLDNASPCNRSRYITHANPQNTFIGGGIRDCIVLAERASSAFLFLMMNDIEPLTPIDIERFENVISARDDIVQIASSVTQDSDKAKPYPWMVNQPGGIDRIVPHCDLLCCMLRIDFIRLFGGFPVSKSGWGYDWEIAYQAYQQGKIIVVSDRCIIEHGRRKIGEEPIADSKSEKREELIATYRSRYGNFERIFIDMVRDIQRRGEQELTE
jgi:hypothetical protein